MGIRRAAAAGKFYNGDKDVLRKDVLSYVQNQGDSSDTPIQGIIAPHAGYAFSGEIAGRAYAYLKNKTYNIVCVISPSHQAYFEGCSIYPGEGYETPLGVVPINISACDELVQNTEVEHSEQGHIDEHALEVQLPFLQIMLKNEFSLIPIVMGCQSDKQISLLSKVIKSLKEQYKQTILFVASSDLSHFHSYEKASQMDKQLINYMTDYDYQTMWNDIGDNKIEACGGGPIIALMKGLDTEGRQIENLGYRNSGDVIPDKSSVVGYTSAIIKNNN